MQEMLSRLEREWGFAGQTRFPVPWMFDDQTMPCSTATGPRAISMRHFFIDFSPLLALRRRLNAELGARIGGELTVGALLLWMMAHQPQFAHVRCGMAVDIPADGASARSVNLVVIRPSDYFSRDAWGGLVRYAREFSRLIHQTRSRQGRAYRMTSRIALLPPRLQWMAVKFNAERTRRTFGSMGVSIIRDAKIFLRPWGISPSTMDSSPSATCGWPPREAERLGPSVSKAIQGASENIPPPSGGRSKAVWSLPTRLT